MNLCQSLCEAVAVLLWAPVSATWLPAAVPPGPSEALVSGNAVNALLLVGPLAWRERNSGWDLTSQDCLPGGEQVEEFTRPKQGSC